jgi:RNA polymerase sigma-70 factor (ECF subfamily)
VTLPHEQPTETAQAADRRLVEALRRGDETAFGQLIDMYHAPMLRLARSFVADRTVAEEVVQEAWLGVFAGSSAKRGARERRAVPFSALAAPGENDEGVVDADRFLPAGHLWAGHWASGPTPWGTAPEERLLASDAGGDRGGERDAAGVAAAGRHLRDGEGWSAAEVCDALEITEVNQRVLLHRERAKVRASLAGYLGGPDAA